MHKCHIYETFKPVKDLKKTNENGLMTLSGVFGVCGVVNNNRRVYETGNYKKMVESMQARIKAEGGVPGELEHPAGMNITLENISHKITDIQIDENGVVSGTIQLLNTPKGKIAQSIVEGGLPLYVSSRATGSVDKGGRVTLENLCTYDLVGTPGFSQAKMHLNESLQEMDNVVLVIQESNEENNNPVDIQELKEQIEALKSTIAEMKRDRKPHDSWFADNIEQWLNEHYMPKFAEKTEQWLREHYMPEFAEKTEQWLREHYMPEFAEKTEQWLNEHYTPDANIKFADRIDAWFANHKNGEIKEAVEQFVKGEYSEKLEQWLNEHYKQQVIDDVNTFITEHKSNSLGDIKNILTMLEGLEQPKPAFGRVLESNEPAFIANMPMKFRPLYEAASPEVKDMIGKRAKLYSFHSEDAVEKFWESVKWEQPAPKDDLQVLRESLRLRKR